jgi:hypothetical protein
MQSQQEEESDDDTHQSSALIQLSMLHDTVAPSECLLPLQLTLLAAAVAAAAWQVPVESKIETIYSTGQFTVLLIVACFLVVCRLVKCLPRSRSLLLCCWGMPQSRLRHCFVKKEEEE